MSQSLIPNSSYGSVGEGQPFSTGFSNASKPQPGSASLSVTLQRVGPDEITVYIFLMQGPKVLASTSVNPTTSPQQYTLTATSEQLSQAVQGTCNLDGLSLQITSASISAPCCPDRQLPAALTAQVSFGTLNTTVGMGWVQSTEEQGYWEGAFKCGPSDWDVILQLECQASHDYWGGILL